MHVAALVISVDEAERLQTSLPAAVAQADEVLVVDNACTDATVAVARHAGAQVLALPERLSYAAAVNAGLAGVSRAAEAVLLLNADCMLEEGFVAAAAGALDDPGVGSVAALL